MSEEGEETEEKGEETEEVPEALEEAPADFVVDVSGLEVMIKISDLLYEASRSSEPSKYIEEIERLSSSVIAVKEKKRERKADKKEEKAIKKRKSKSK